MKTIIIFLLLGLQGVSSYAQETSPYQKKYFSRDGQSLPYRILYPKDYDSSKPYPVLTFLHGSGERGTDNERQLINGGSLFTTESIRNSFRAIVIFPQCSEDYFWSHFTYRLDPAEPTGYVFDFSFFAKATPPALLIKALLDSLVGGGIADQDRMYIGGLSMGGIGTYDFIQRYPGYFAAAIAICGGGDTSLVGNIAKKTALWIFHGDKDELVDVKHSRLYHTALKRAGADVLYREYPGIKHDSYEIALKELHLLSWLSSKIRHRSLPPPGQQNY
jgi:predicted peptidase